MEQVSGFAVVYVTKGEGAGGNLGVVGCEVDYLAGESHGTRDEQSAVGYPGRHHAKFGFLDEADKILYLVLEVRVLEVFLSIRVGGLIASVCV